MKKLAFALVIVTALSPVFGARADDAQLVGEDVAGDWASVLTGDSSLAPVGDATGQDLISASIDNSSAGVVKFIFGVTGLPEGGGVPEAVRYIWLMEVDGLHYELDGKFTNYSRGACDPTAGTCPPPRDPGPQPFIVRGNCGTVGGQVASCEEIGLVQGVFDPGTATISVAVPLSMISKKPCGEILPGTSPDSFSDANLLTIPSAFYSYAAVTVYDYMVLNEDMDVIVC